MNVDYKICSKAVSIRLAGVIGSIVDPDQTCSIPGRSIFFKPRLITGHTSLYRMTGESGILLFLDQEKAFDRIDRSFLLNLLELFGFGPWFLACIETPYNGAYMQVLVNELLSDSILLERGV